MGDIGLTLPISTPDHAPNTVARCAPMAEQAGAHSLWTIDRLTFGNQEPLLAMAAAAALTDRVKLGTSVLLGTLRGPAQLAKQIATLDQLSAGRVILGLGVGSRTDDFEAAGVPFEHRGTRAEELVDILRLAWSGEPVRYAGRFYSMDVGPIGPRPVQSHIPIWFGGSAEPALRRVGRLADGFIGGSSRGAEGFLSSMEAVRTAATAAGREAASLTGATLMMVSIDDDHDRARQRAFDYQANYYSSARANPDQCVLGSVDECAEQIRTYLNVGADVLILNPVTSDIGHYERMCFELLPKLKDG
ncbi:MAG TPA: LLM class flavin-dependent oxidoreductase [Chloroflexota bacterium]|nr:LLM class flavin-dependent oxidoreductase [Chloroflexota bacterium]